MHANALLRGQKARFLTFFAARAKLCYDCSPPLNPADSGGRAEKRTAGAVRACLEILQPYGLGVLNAKLHCLRTDMRFLYSEPCSRSG